MFCRGGLYPLHPLVKVSTRSLASVSSTFDARSGTVGPFQVFDRNAKRVQKDRAASRDGGARSRTVDYVRDEVADRMMERLLVLGMNFFTLRMIMDSSVTGHSKTIRYYC